MTRLLDCRRRCAAALVATFLFCGLVSARAAEPEPIRIGFGEAQTGSLAAIGKSGILAMEIWAEKVNAEGGLLGRPVKLIYYDTQSNPANVPGIYVKLLDVDHVDFVLSSYSTNMAAPAMPIVIGHNKLFLTLFALAVNSEFHYPRCFAMIATGPDPKRAFSQGFFDIAMSLDPETRNVSDPGCRRRICSQRDRWRPVERQGCRASDRLRQQLSADHHGFYPGGTGRARDQPRCHLCRLLPDR